MGKTMRRVLMAWAAVSMVGGLAWGAAPAGRYVVNAETVLDTKTGLRWQRTVPGATYTWANAQTYCQGLNLGGYTSGWRVPSTKELQSLVDRRVSSPLPKIDETAFPSTPQTVFWSSSQLAGGTSYAWWVAFNTGVSWYYAVTSSYRVRCVR